MLRRLRWAEPLTRGRHRFYPPIAAARDEAVAAGRGLYSPDTTCTVPGQVKAVVAAAEGLAVANPAAPSADLDAAVVLAADAVALAAALDSAFADEHVDAVWSAIAPEERSQLGALVKTAHETAMRTESETRSAATAARQRENAEAAERERQAQEQAERQQQEEDTRAQEARERQAREQREQEARERESDAEPDRAPKPESKKPDPKYTGPRCYDPGGVTWKPC